VIPRQVLRDDVLSGHVVAAAGDLGDALAALGARVVAVEDASAETDTLVYDLRPPFAAGGMDGLRAALDGAWVAMHAVVNRAMVPDERGGKVCLVAPRADAGPHAGAARDAAENLARVLSIEWSRFQVRPVAITPGPGTSEEDLATIVAYLASPAGDYFSGCVLALA
jgi:NAD(P)-dependent dehydrogenase (short-subunit alcohol dehydrogenase family)